MEVISTTHIDTLKYKDKKHVVCCWGDMGFKCDYLHVFTLCTLQLLYNVGLAHREKTDRACSFCAQCTVNNLQSSSVQWVQHQHRVLADCCIAFTIHSIIFALYYEHFTSCYYLCRIQYQRSWNIKRKLLYGWSFITSMQFSGIK